jgi:hypothetical protein
MEHDAMLGFLVNQLGVTSPEPAARLRSGQTA